MHSRLLSSIHCTADYLYLYSSLLASLVTLIRIGYSLVQRLQIVRLSPKAITAIVMIGICLPGSIYYYPILPGRYIGVPFEYSNSQWMRDILQAKVHASLKETAAVSAYV